MTIDSRRLDYLRERMESGNATVEEYREWIRSENTEQEEGLRKTEKEIASALDAHRKLAISDLRERLMGLTGAELIKAGRDLWEEFQKLWGDEAAREAWKVVQPPRRQGRKEWQAIPPRRPRSYRSSDRVLFQRASQANRVALLTTMPTQKDRALSKEKAARMVRGDQEADPARNFRKRKVRPTIRD